MSVSPQERLAASLQSFTTKAVAVLVLYWLGWIPGFIANILFYQESKRIERIAGKRLPGTGCLRVMLGFNIVLLIVALALTVLLLVSIRVNGQPLLPLSST